MRIVEGVYDGKTVHISERINAKPNTRVTIAFPDDDASYSTVTPETLDGVAGCLQWRGPAKTIEEMDLSTPAEARRAVRRIRMGVSLLINEELAEDIYRELLTLVTAASDQSPPPYDSNATQ